MSGGGVELNGIKLLKATEANAGPPPYYGTTNQAFDPEDVQSSVTSPGPIVHETPVDVHVIETSDTNEGKQQFREKPVFGEEEEQYEESSDDDDEYASSCQRHIAHARRGLTSSFAKHEKALWTLFWLIVAVLYFLYFGYAMYKTFNVHDEGSMRLLVVTVIGATGGVMYLVSTHILKGCRCDLGFLFDEDNRSSRKIRLIVFWVLIIVTAAFIVAFIAIDIGRHRPRNLISAIGMASFVLFMWIFSKNPGKVNWRPVYWGLALQFFFALIILRWKFGYEAFEWLGERVQEFLGHTDAGSAFVFGEKYMDHFFAFKVLTVIVFFSSAVSVLYYWGVMQFIIKYIARFLAFCLGTSPTESLNAAGNIFLGQSEAPLMIRPFLKTMTKSEIHAVCTGGFATIAGSVMAAYMAIGVPANHLLSASVMSAPAALAMSKLFYPETKKSRVNNKDVYNMPKGQETNFIEALSKGASLSITLIANIAVNLIAFIAALHFLDATLTWLGHRADRYDPEITFSYICSYVFYPVAWVMGVEGGDDCRKVASLIGTKTFLNEFVAYVDLSYYINDTNTYNAYMGNATGVNNGTTMDGDNIHLNYYNYTLQYGLLSDRSTVIATYSLCGFSNISSIGIMIGALGAMAPTRRKDIVKVVVRAMIAGNVACFMTASIAGLLYDGEKGPRHVALP